MKWSEVILSFNQVSTNVAVRRYQICNIISCTHNSDCCVWLDRLYWQTDWTDAPISSFPFWHLSCCYIWRTWNVEPNIQTNFGFRQDRQTDKHTDGQTHRHTDAINRLWAFLVLKNLVRNSFSLLYWMKIEHVPNWWKFCLSKQKCNFIPWFLYETLYRIIIASSDWKFSQFRLLLWQFSKNWEIGNFCWWYESDINIIHDYNKINKFLYHTK